VEERAARNPSREGKHRCGSHGGSDLLREDLELLRGGQSEEETGVSRRRTGGERRNGICGRFNRYTLCDLDIYCTS